MLLHKSVEHDARVLREASALTEAGHEVKVVDLPRPAGGRGPLSRSYRLARAAAGLARRAAAERPDVVHAHDAAMLLPGLLAARRARARLVYDSHELATGVPYRSGAWAGLVATVERIGAKRADATITVSDGIAARLSERYRLRRDPVVVRNVPDLPPPAAASAPDLREDLFVGGAPLVLHQGAVAPGRGCETLIRAVTELDGAHLLFLGAWGSYSGKLRLLAAKQRLGDRVHFLRPAPLRTLLSYTAQADVGVSLLEDSCENHRLALPNKLFEYLAAGLPVVVSDLPEMATLVRDRGVGWTADPADPKSVARALRAAIDASDDAGLRARVDTAASELTWEQEKRHLLALYEELERT